MRKFSIFNFSSRGGSVFGGQFSRIMILLILILLIAAVLRFWQLGNIPPSPDWDEVALGYNAYSLLETGKDEFGKTFPVVLRSFDDYKPALYVYLIIPFIPIFDLTVFAVRFPSAIFGILTILAVFFLVKELFYENKYKEYLALLVSFLLAISPWHIQVSRVAFETNIGLSFNIFAALFFIKGLKKPYLLILSAIFAGLSLYTYQSEKVFTPIFILLLFLVYLTRVIKIPKKYIVTSILVGMIVILPTVFYIFTNKESLLRAKATSVFADSTQLLKDSAAKIDYDIKNDDKIGLVFDNRRIVYIKTIISGYISHYDFNWLFVEGDLKRHHAPGMGLLYLFELPFFLIGIYMLIFGKYNLKTKLLVLGWFLIAPIPASITTGVPHALRTLNFLPTFQIFTAIGIISAVGLISNFKFQISNFRIWKLFAILFLLFAGLNFIYYLNQYFVQQNYFYANQWQYGWEQAANYVKENENKFDKILVSDTQPLDRSYMFFAFYLKFPPNKYQEVGANESGGFAQKHFFEKYEFRSINWEVDSKSEKILIVAAPSEIPGSVTPSKTIYNPDKSPAILIIEK